MNTTRRLLSIIIFLSFSFAQDITNKLGASGNYDVTDSADKVLFRVQGDGNVGIGTDTPDEKLHIVGSVKIINGTQGPNKKLLSDVSGKTVWSDGIKGPQGPKGNTGINGASIGNPISWSLGTTYTTTNGGILMLQVATGSPVSSGTKIYVKKMNDNTISGTWSGHYPSQANTYNLFVHKNTQYQIYQVGSYTTVYNDFKYYPLY